MQKRMLVGTCMLGIAAILLALGWIGHRWWSENAQIGAVALRGLKWQAQLGSTPYVPGAGGLVQIGSQADLLARYLTSMDQTATTPSWRSLSSRLVHETVWAQHVGSQASWIQYLATERRYIQNRAQTSAITITGLITIWVSRQSGQKWQVSGVAYNFDPLGLPYQPPTVSYLRQSLTAQVNTPLGE